MFNNIGAKIKGIAQFITVVGIIICIIAGFVIMTIDEDLIIVGLLVMVLGSLIFWLSSFILYAFGQLVDNTDKLVELQQPSDNKTDNLKLKSLENLKAKNLISEEEYINKRNEIMRD